MESTETTANTTQLPEAILTEVQARLPLRSISRFKSVCKTWKSTTESVYFRRLFSSIHQNSSLLWSLITYNAKELMGFKACKTRNLPKSLALFSRNPASPHIRYWDSSNGLVLIEGVGCGCYVGNPVLQQWVEIPSPPPPYTLLSLATRVDKDGVVLGFKVVSLAAVRETCIHLNVYSSATGIWNAKRLHIQTWCIINFTISINETIYFASFCLGDHRAVISHDFFDESDQCSVTSLPNPYDDEDESSMRAVLTTNKESVLYIRTSVKYGKDMLKVWRLINGLGNNGGCWNVLWVSCLPNIRYDTGFYAPMIMHPLDSDIVYLWNQHGCDLILFNLRTKDYRILIDSSNSFGVDDNLNCFVDHPACVKFIRKIWGTKFTHKYEKLVSLSPFVLPRWMECVPRPPTI